jgi:hypothetical protein
LLAIPEFRFCRVLASDELELRPRIDNAAGGGGWRMVGLQPMPISKDDRNALAVAMTVRARYRQRNTT